MALEDYRGNMQRCSRCSYCKWVLWDHLKSRRFAKGCPSIGYNNFQSYAAGGRLAATLSLLDGRSTYTDGFIDIVYQCQMCGACDIACKICRYDMEPLETMRELRLRMVEDGQLVPEHMLLIDSLKKENTMMAGEARIDRGKWAEGLSVKDLTREKAEVAFHAGCRLSYDRDLSRVARAAISLLTGAGVDVGIRGRDEDCCAGRAYEIGYKGEMIKFSQSNMEAWSNAGVKTVITACSDCNWAFKRLYGQAGSGVEVLHMVEFIDRLLKEGRLTFTKRIPKVVTYHDPCHLGRLGEPYVSWNGMEKRILGQMLVHEPKKPRYNGIFGVYDAPRNIIASIPGVRLVEMERVRENAWCCGAGGGVIDAYPELCSWTVAERIEEAEATGAEALVSACPWCERNFIDAIEARGTDMLVYDIMDLIQQAL